MRVLYWGKGPFLKEASAVLSLTSKSSRRDSICSVGSSLLNCHRQYRSQPTHRIGRYGHLLPSKASKKRRASVHMKEIDPGTEHEYGSLSIVMTGYDMTLVEHYMKYIHKLCNRLSIIVQESYAMPTRTTEVMLTQEQGSKMKLDGVLTTHQRVVQIKGLTATFAPILLEVLWNNQPEGVHLLVKEHTEEDFKIRLKDRPELEQLLSQLN
ncbi:39S ribosomal protein L48, mitochondrial isoform X2 [Varanus komodoensis]|uniref:39S ribosomal protein L48, mitochondrial isoform X2 n=1 Tax=Varanus komodoensis TaxID=61221 RepID=UPI001CF7E55A|nr:39S ribosomal protein L48, mitochondrial isoform X2 [Varanus komodoensis]